MIENYINEYFFEVEDEKKNQILNTKSGSGLFSTYHTEFFSKEELEIKNYLDGVYTKLVEDFMRSINLYNHSVYDFHYWWQIYSPGSKHPPHCHADSSALFSWVHFLEVDELNPCFYYLDNKNEKIYVGEKCGKMIIFPSWMLHGVDPPNKLRAVVAGNIYLTSIKVSEEDTFTWT